MIKVFSGGNGTSQVQLKQLNVKMQHVRYGRDIQ